MLELLADLSFLPNLKFGLPDNNISHQPQRLNRKPYHIPLSHALALCHARLHLARKRALLAAHRQRHIARRAIPRRAARRPRRAALAHRVRRAKRRAHVVREARHDCGRWAFVGGDVVLRPAGEGDARVEGVELAERFMSDWRWK